MTERKKKCNNILYILIVFLFASSNPEETQADLQTDGVSHSYFFNPLDGT